MFRKRKDTKSENPLLKEVRAAVFAHDKQRLQELIHVMKTTPVASRHDGADLLCAALSCKEGLDIFFEDQEWRDTLTKDELNHPDKFLRNALYLIVHDERGRHLLQQDAIFRKKITAEGFSYFSDNHISPVRVLVGMQGGLQVLKDTPDLQALITVRALNDKHGDGMPLIFELAKNPEGIAILFHPKVRSKINEEGLNARSVSVSTLSLLTSCQEGILLVEDERICALIHPNTLNIVNREHMTPLANLCHSPYGQEMLLQHRRLAKKVLPIAMTAMEQDGTTPFFHLTKTEKGLQILKKYDHLCRMMTERTMNQICERGADKGASTLFNLLSHPHGVELLCRHRDWLSLMTKDGVHAHRQFTDDNNVSVIDLLKRPENTAVFVLLPEAIREEVNYWHARLLEQKALKPNPAALFTAPVASAKNDAELATLTL